VADVGQTMRFIATKLPLIYMVEPTRVEDERGFFARTWSPEEFVAHGLNPRLALCCLSFNRRQGTLRGLHYQAAPYGEAKLVRCTQGAIYDVAVDLRPDSPTYMQWTAAELTADNHRMLYIAEGCAHGFQTLTDDSEVCYQISAPYNAEAGRIVRWNDPAFGIAWRSDVPISVISERDRTCADWVPG
jgi:dTDP-4-dehydrorhamnose 3,5-epimerase